MSQDYTISNTVSSAIRLFRFVRCYVLIYGEKKNKIKGKTKDYQWDEKKKKDKDV